MMKKLGKIWSNFTPNEKKVYDDVARKDKERYTEEMKLLTVNGLTIDQVHAVESLRPKK